MRSGTFYMRLVRFICVLVRFICVLVRFICVLVCSVQPMQPMPGYPASEEYIYIYVYVYIYIHISPHGVAGIHPLPPGVAGIQGPMCPWAHGRLMMGPWAMAMPWHCQVQVWCSHRSVDCRVFKKRTFSIFLNI